MTFFHQVFLRKKYFRDHGHFYTGYFGEKNIFVAMDIFAPGISEKNIFVVEDILAPGILEKKDFRGQRHFSTGYFGEKRFL